MQHVLDVSGALIDAQTLMTGAEGFGRPPR